MPSSCLNSKWSLFSSHILHLFLLLVLMEVSQDSATFFPLTCTPMVIPRSLLALNTIYILTIPKHTYLAQTFFPNSRLVSRQATWHLQEMHLNLCMSKSAGLAFSPSPGLHSVKDTTIFIVAQISSPSIVHFFLLTSHFFYSFSRSCCFCLKHICQLLWDLLTKKKAMILTYLRDQITTMWKKPNNLIYLRK